MRTISWLMLYVFLLVAPLVAAELPPSVYISRADSAPEALIVEVILVRTTQPAKKTTLIEAKSKVVQVRRSEAGLKEGRLLDIRYVTVTRPPGWVGPSQPPILKAGEVIPAFLSRKGDSEIYEPAAGGKSFSHWVWDHLDRSHEGMRSEEN